MQEHATITGARRLGSDTVLPIDNDPSRASHGWAAPAVASLVLTLGIAAGGHRLYSAIEQHALTEREQALMAVSALTARGIEAWREERLADARAIGALRWSESVMNAWVRAQPRDAAMAQTLQPALASFARAHGYRSMLLFDASGELRLASDDNEPVDDSLRAVVRTAVARRETRFLDFRTALDPGRPASIDVVVPQDVGSAGGAVVLRAELERALLPMLRHWPASSRSGECLIARAEGTNLRLLHEGRFPVADPLPAAMPLALTLPAGKDAPAGVFEALDYRGVAVYAIAQPIAGSDWTLVTKIDRVEAERPIQALAWQTGLAVSGLVTLVLLAASTLVASALERWRLATHTAQLERLAVTEHYDHLAKYASEIVMLTDVEGHIIEANAGPWSATGTAAPNC